MKKKKVLKNKWQFILLVLQLIIMIMMIFAINDNIYYTLINEYILIMLFVLDNYILHKYSNIDKNGGL